MPSRSISVSPPRNPLARSLEAYVVPQVLDGVTNGPGFVSTIFVREQDLVVQGQPLANVERRWEAWPQRSDDEALECVKAPTSGRIVRCWVAAGNAVGPMRPIVSIVSCEDVLVVARFARGTGSFLRRARLASVLLGGSLAKATPAKIISIVEVPNGGGDDDPELDSGAIRVILHLGSAPDEALWPGMPVLVEV